MVLFCEFGNITIPLSKLVRERRLVSYCSGLFGLVGGVLAPRVCVSLRVSMVFVCGCVGKSNHTTNLQRSSVLSTDDARARTRDAGGGDAGIPARASPTCTRYGNSRSSLLLLRRCSPNPSLAPNLSYYIYLLTFCIYWIFELHRRILVDMASAQSVARNCRKVRTLSLTSPAAVGVEV